MEITVTTRVDLGDIVKVNQFGAKAYQEYYGHTNVEYKGKNVQLTSIEYMVTLIDIKVTGDKANPLHAVRCGIIPVGGGSTCRPLPGFFHDDLTLVSKGKEPQHVKSIDSNYQITKEIDGVEMRLEYLFGIHALYVYRKYGPTKRPLQIKKVLVGPNNEVVDVWERKSQKNRNRGQTLSGVGKESMLKVREKGKGMIGALRTKYIIDTIVPIIRNGIDMLSNNRTYVAQNNMTEKEKVIYYEGKIKCLKTEIQTYERLINEVKTTRHNNN